MQRTIDFDRRLCHGQITFYERDTLLFSMINVPNFAELFTVPTIQSYKRIFTLESDKTKDTET
jgi:hypothetical protein